MSWEHINKNKRKLTMICMKKEKVLAEIAKCDVVCSNCHRVRTYKRRLEASRKAG